MKTYTVKLPPLLYDEVYGHTVETGLMDHRSGNDVGLTAADVSLYEKIEKGESFTVGRDEAASLYNELFNLIDFLAEWAENEGVKYLSARKAALRRMEELRTTFDLQLNPRGWAVKGDQ